MNANFERSMRRAYANAYEGNALDALRELIADLLENPDTECHPAVEECRRRLGDDSMRNAVDVKAFLDVIA